jgi:hypothetical protein
MSCGSAAPILIRQDGAHGKRPGRPIDGGRNVIQRAPIRISLVGLQSDFDRILLEVFRGHAEAPHVGANVQHLLLVDVEVHVNRSGQTLPNDSAQVANAASAAAGSSLAYLSGLLERARGIPLSGLGLDAACRF